MIRIVRAVALLAVLTAGFGAAGFTFAGVIGLAGAVATTLVVALLAYLNADRMVLRMAKAEEIADDDASPIHRAIMADLADMAERADMNAPRLFIIDTPQPNAFAVGRNQSNAAIAATTGLLSLLNRREVAGVMAHELAHIQNRDTLGMTMTAAFAGGLTRVASFVAAPVAAGLVKLSARQEREYAADELGAEICGDPLWLATALEKIERGARAQVNRHAERNPATSSIYIIHPLAGRKGGKRFSTHPDTANRVAALRQMASEDHMSDDDYQMRRHGE